MPFNDAELDRLARERDAAKRRRNHANQELEAAYNRYQFYKQNNGSRIDSCKRELDNLFTNKEAARNSASNAYHAGDHYGAKSYSNEVRRLQDRISRVVDEKHHLVQQLREERPKFERAKEAYRELKAEHERAQDAFNARLEHCKREAKRERGQKERDRARLQQEREARKKREREQKERDHARLKQEREARKSRLRQQRGSFIKLAKQRYQQLREADSRYRPNGSRGRDTQYADSDVKVEVTNGYSRKYDAYTTDVLIIPRDGSGLKVHIVFDENGREIFNRPLP